MQRPYKKRRVRSRTILGNPSFDFRRHGRFSFRSGSHVSGRLDVVGPGDADLSVALTTRPAQQAQHTHSSGIATVNLSWIFLSTSWSSSVETKVMPERGVGEWPVCHAPAARSRTETLGTETTSTTDAVQIGVGISGSVLRRSRTDQLSRIA